MFVDLAVWAAADPLPAAMGDCLLLELPYPGDEVPENELETM
jgi:hypothetical protein